MKRYFRIIIYIALLLEIFLFPQIENIIGAIISIVIFELFSKYVYSKQNIKRYPLSIFAFSALFVFCYLPIIMTLIDGHPITFKMTKPILTFNHQLLFVIITILAFQFSKKSFIEHSLSSFFNKNIFVNPLNKVQILILSIIGIISRIYTLFFVDESGGGGLAVTFGYLIYTPLIFVFKNLSGENIHVNKKYIYIYMLFIMALGVGTNKRSFVFMIVFFYILLYVLNAFVMQKYIFSLKQIIIGVVLFLFVSGPITDFALSMVIVRSYKEDVSATALVNKTLQVFNDKETLAYARNSFFSDRETGNVYEAWNEYYVNNLFFERYCNYRVADATLCNAYKIGFCNDNMKDYFIWFLQSSFPGPLLKVLGCKVDKTKYEDFSTNDILMKQSFGRIAGGHMVGGDVGLGLATMGWWFYLIHFVVFYIIFSVLNAMVTYKQNNTVVMPLIALLLINRIFRLFVFDDGIAQDIRFIIWELPFFVICYMIIRKLLYKFK